MNRSTQNFTYRILDNRFLLIVLATVFALGMIFTTYVFTVPETQALNTCPTGYQVLGSSKTINCSGICRVVSKGGASIFVGTRTASEYNTFIGNPPVGTSISSCPVVTDGTFCSAWCQTGFAIPYLGTPGCGVPGDLVSAGACAPGDWGIWSSAEFCSCTTACNNSGC